MAIKQISMTKICGIMSSNDYIYNYIKKAYAFHCRCIKAVLVVIESHGLVVSSLASLFCAKIKPITY